MNKKTLDRTYKLFYSDYKFLEKMLYIKKVMDSCETIEQLDHTINWGQSVLRNLFTLIEVNVSMPYSVYCELNERVTDVECELLTHYDNLVKKLEA